MVPKDPLKAYKKPTHAIWAQRTSLPTFRKPRTEPAKNLQTQLSNMQELQNRKMYLLLTLDNIPR
jgi:hypothetical protein